MIGPCQRFLEPFRRCSRCPFNSPCWGARNLKGHVMEMNLFQLSGFGGLIVLALAIYALVSIFGSNASNGTKALWALVVILLPLIGFIAWLIAGPRSAASQV